MPRKCIFRCSYFRRLYSFPHEEECRRKWCELLSLDMEKVVKSHRLCDLHFDEYECTRRLDYFTLPKKREINESAPTTSAGTASQPPCNSDDAQFETVYLTDKTQLVRTYGSQPTNSLQVHTHSKTNATQETTEESISPQNCSEIDADESAAQFEPVDTAFKAPPKRTYGHSINSNVKTPKLDITATCYCRCHKGEDEKIHLKKTIEEMKMRETEQAREINLLISKNKVSEHLLKGKVKKITELMNQENSLRKTIDGLNTRISLISKRQIKAAPNASENSIILARMICDRRKKYTKSEVIVANKLYAISGRCYYFMRDVLKLNLPHPTTLLRNSKIFSPVPEEHTIYRDYDGDTTDQEHQEPIIFSPELMHEQHEEELHIEVDV